MKYLYLVLTLHILFLTGFVNSTGDDKFHDDDGIKTTGIEHESERDINETTTGKVEEESESKKTYEGIQLVRVQIKNNEQRSWIRELSNKGEIDTWLTNGTVADIVIHDNETIQILHGKNLKFDIVINDLQNAINEENPTLSDDEIQELVGRKVGSSSSLYGDGIWYLTNRLYTPYINPLVRNTQIRGRRKKIRRRKGHRLTWQMYHQMDDIHGYLDYLANTYPQTCKVETIGHSVEGRPLKLLKISSGKPNRPAIWVDSGIHAREWITPASLTWAVSQMVENGDGTHDVDWYVLPIVNPDGYQHSRQVDRLWRKNRANPERKSCAGTDLNRNFGFRWGGQGASKQPCRETFAGTKAFSEPETNAINTFVTARTGQIKGYVSLHSYGQYILYPWGYDRKVPPDYADLDRVGRAMANAIQVASGQSYTVGAAANTLYPASGGSDDWAKGSARIKYAYTIELRDTGRHGFVLPASYIVPTAKDAYAALKVLAKEVQ